MLAVFDRPETSKHLYFNLNNSFHLANPQCSPTYKIAGVYAIYKNNICYYVGQSKNLPSRISTHLSGKYINADRVDLYFIGEETFCGFYSRSKNEQRIILENNECHVIGVFKPIENIISIEKDIGEDELADNIIDCIGDKDHYSPDLNIYINEFNITITESGWQGVESIHENVMDEYIGYLAAMKKGSHSL